MVFERRDQAPVPNESQTPATNALCEEIARFAMSFVEQGRYSCSMNSGNTPAVLDFDLPSIVKPSDSRKP